MRIHEIVVQNLVASGRVVASASAKGLISPATLPEVVIVETADDSIAVATATPGDVVLLMLGESLVGADVLKSLPANATAVLLLTVPPEKLPVGAVLEALHAWGSQVLDVVAVQRLPTPAVALVVKHLRHALPIPYLSRSVGEADHDSALQRIVGEWVLESFVRRAETRLADEEATRSAEERSHLQQTVAARDEAISSLKMQIDGLNQELAASRNRVAKLQEHVEIFEGSRSVRMGRAINRLRADLRRWVLPRGSTNSAKGHDDS